MSDAPVNPNQALWEKGDFTRIASTMRESGEELVRRIGLRRGQRVLDLGCGDGNTALPAAKAGAEVLGVDIARTAYTPPPPEGFVSPMTWGVESSVSERFAGAGIPAGKMSFLRDTFTFRFAGSPQQYVDEFRRHYGPTMNAFEAAEKNGRAANLQVELERLFSAQNTSADGTTIPATFLRVEVAC